MSVIDDWGPIFAAFIGEQADDPAHDGEHVRRVVSNALRLSAAEGARLEVVYPAAWLHDCVMVPKDSPQRAQASGLAATKAVAFLREIGYAAACHEDIAHAIEAHSFTAGVPPRSIEAKVVQDADRLDAIGAIGIARCLALGGHLGRRLYVAEDPFCRGRIADDRASTIDHFYTKLLRLADTMQTAAGRREAAARTAFMTSYLSQLGVELGR